MTVTTMTEDEFRAHLASHGYGPMASRVYEPGVETGSADDFHAHDFSAMLMIAEGEFTVVYKDGPTTFGPGQWCEVPAGTPHYERTGSAGATVLSGKK